MGFKRIARDTRGFLTRFAHATRGNVALMFGLTLPVMVMMVAGGIDLHHASTVKAKLQDALDAAALAAARSKYIDDTNINRIGMAALKANMKGFDDERDTASFHLTNDSVVVATARLNVKTLIANIVLPPYGKLMDDRLPVSANSEVHRASKNVEVSLVLDITGSMAGSRMTALKAAANELVEIVVQDQQTPFYSKVALVPYSMGVNVGGYADAVRGALQQATPITGAVWAADTAKSITSISRANPGVVTATNHGLQTGDYIWLTGVSRMSSLNDNVYRVTVTSTSQFRLNSTSTTSFSQTGQGGTFRKCLATNCDVVVTSANHSLSDGDYVRITGVRGMTQLNNANVENRADYVWTASRLSAHTFHVPVLGPTANTYTNSGSAQCGYDGCEKRFYLNPSNNFRNQHSSTCVSERAGVNDNTDVAPSSASTRVGRSYPNSDNSCPNATITPLSSNRDTLQAQINSYPAVGSTAGQIGIGWGWYMISPRFNYIWPTESQAGPYGDQKYMKVVIIMTDGEFNTPYCEGVIGRQAGSGSGDANARINCPGTLAPRSQGLSPFIEAAKVCEGIKREGVLVYSVGFSISSSTGGQGMDTAKEVLDSCATSPQHVYMAASGSDLQDAFRAIGREITRLRISR